ncbi:MAG: thioesterase family protein [Pseudomonadales bacterium]|nr:thioesterase family protein [Pseudomonadales bacterium]
MTEAYYTLEAGKYRPSVHCRGPWDPDSLSGSVVVALLAFQIEQEVDTSEYMPARLTVDMYRLPDFSPIEIRTTLVRDGYRIKVIDAEFISNGTSMARATCQLLRRTGNAPTRVWKPEPWKVPLPEDISVKPEFEMIGVKRRRPIDGEMGSFGQKRMWLSENRDLVEGTTLSAWLRAVLVADLTNPWANSGDGGLGYINSDVTLYLHRVPCDEWIGMEVTNHQATDGVAIGECWLYDREGLIGSSSVTGLAQQRRPANDGSRSPAHSQGGKR